MASSARIDELRKKFDENPRRYFAPLANEYRKAGDVEQAIAICREYLPQQPGHMSGHIVYGQALYEARQFEEARTVFETALSLDPENLIALRHLGDIALITGDTDGARGWYTRVLEADPRNEEIQAQLKSIESGVSAPPMAAPTPQAASGASAEPGTGKPTPSSAPTVVVSAMKPPATERTVEQPAIPRPMTPPAGTDAVAATPAASAPDLGRVPTVEITTPAPKPVADIPTLEIALDAVPTPDLPNTDRIEMESQAADAGDAREVGAELLKETPAIGMALGFEPTAATSGDEPSAASLPIEKSESAAPPVDSFTLEGLETTSMAGEPLETPPGAIAEPQPLADLVAAVDVAPPPTPVASDPESSTDQPAGSDLPLFDFSLPSSEAAATSGLDAAAAEKSRESAVEIPETATAAESRDGAAEPSELSELSEPVAAFHGEPTSADSPIAHTAPDLELALPDNPAPAPPAATEAGPFVTETMAELYLQQGHRDEALRVYRALVEQRPFDDQLQRRVAELEGSNGGPSIRDLLRRVATWQSGARDQTTARAPTPPAPPAETATMAATKPDLPSLAEALPAVEEISGATAIAPPSAPAQGAEPAGPAALRPDALTSLLGGVTISDESEAAARTLATAFASVANGNRAASAQVEGPGIDGSPARPAAKDLSLDAVFGTQPQASPQPATFSFDQFFSERATAEQPGSAPVSGGQESRDDVAQFTQWLEGLKQR